MPQREAEGIVLRYGSFYGPGASDVMLDVVRKRQLPVVGGGTGVWSFSHVADAAAATVAAVGQGAPGRLQHRGQEPAPVAEWLPYLARVAGARPPLRVPAWLARLAGRRVHGRLMTTRPRVIERQGKEGARLGAEVRELAGGIP